MKAGTICISLCLLACNAGDLDELRQDEPILNAMLVSADDYPRINYYTLSAEGGIVEPVTEATITLSDTLNNSTVLKFSGGSYSTDQPFIIAPEMKYTIAVSDQSGNELHAQTSIPPAISLVSLSEDTIVVGSPDELAAVLQWTTLDPQQYAYSLRLENLEDTKTQLPFAGGLFDTRYELPQLNAGISLYFNDFSYYGLHRLTVYAIRRDFESIYFYDPSDIRGLLKAAPDNVTGGQGFVTGVSTFNILLYLPM